MATWPRVSNGVIRPIWWFGTTDTWAPANELDRDRINHWISSDAIASVLSLSLWEVTHHTKIISSTATRAGLKENMTVLLSDMKRVRKELTYTDETASRFPNKSEPFPRSVILRFISFDVVFYDERGVRLKHFSNILPGDWQIKY